MALSGVAAQGDATVTTPRPHMEFMGASGCSIGFAFRGFPAGTMGEIDLFFQGHLVFTQMFAVPSPSGVEILQQVGAHIPHPFHQGGELFHGTVAFRVMVQGFPEVLTGHAGVTCFCGPEGMGGAGGSGIGGITGNDIGASGGAGGGGIGGSSGAGTASAATPVSGQPGFTG